LDPLPYGPKESFENPKLRLNINMEKPIRDLGKILAPALFKVTASETVGL